MKYDLIVIGSGPGGEKAAIQAAKLGKRVAVIERDQEPGGSALLLFAQGGAIRLDVECLECELTDLGDDALGAGIEREG